MNVEPHETPEQKQDILRRFSGLFNGILGAPQTYNMYEDIPRSLDSESIAADMIEAGRETEIELANDLDPYEYGDGEW